MIDMHNRNPVVPQHNSDIKEFIICAAIWYNDGKERAHLPRNIKTGIVASGWRHGNCITILAAMYPKRDYILDKNKDDSSKMIQGFLTSDGCFVNRKEAGDLAFKAGQILKKNNFLFSEDLY